MTDAFMPDHSRAAPELPPGEPCTTEVVPAAVVEELLEDVELESVEVSSSVLSAAVDLALLLVLDRVAALPKDVEPARLSRLVASAGVGTVTVLDSSLKYEEAADASVVWTLKIVVVVLRVDVTIEASIWTETVQ